MNIGEKQKRVRREEVPAGAVMGTREERLFGRWLSGAERSLGRQACAMSEMWDFPRGWFRDKLTARMFGRMLGERLCREGGGSPVPYGDVRDAALSAGMDVTDHRFASELLEDLLVVNQENGSYVVQDLGERGCYCAPYNSNASWEAGIPRTLRLPPDGLLRFLGEFDRRLPLIHAAADGLEREVRASLRADGVLMASARAVASESLGAAGIPYTVTLERGRILFEIRQEGRRPLLVGIPRDGYADRIREIPHLAAHPREGRVLYGKDFRYGALEK